MEKVFNLYNDASENVVIDIHGEIGGSWWNEGVTFDDVKDQLKDIAKSDKKILVRICSLGGDVDEALAIYELLVAMGDRVTTECYGRCASAATIIAMSGDKRKMSRYALFLIHKCWSGVVGNENVLEEVLEEQRAINSRMVAIYTDRTGAKQEDIEALMERNNGDGAWLTSDECLEYGFMTEEVKSTGTEGSYLTQKIKSMFNISNSKPMKKNITTLAALAALLAVDELTANKEGAVLLDDEALNKINDALLAKEQRADKLQTNLEAAETAKKEAETAKAAAEEAKTKAESKRDELQAKVNELQAVVDKLPAGAAPVNGDDTKPAGEETFAEWYGKQEYVKAAKEELKR